MRENDCERVRQAFLAALDGEPAALPEAAVSTHLETCEECRVETGRLATLCRDLDGIRLALPEADLWSALRPRLVGKRTSPARHWALVGVAALFPAYRILEAIGPAGLFSALRLAPLALLCLMLLLLRENPFTLDPALRPEGGSR
jgi:predicted anti-sigma-YlaC factor YlaD